MMYDLTFTLVHKFASNNQHPILDHDQRFLGGHMVRRPSPSVQLEQLFSATAPSTVRDRMC